MGCKLVDASMSLFVSFAVSLSEPAAAGAGVVTALTVAAKLASVPSCPLDSRPPGRARAAPDIGEASSSSSRAPVSGSGTRLLQQQSSNGASGEKSFSAPFCCCDAFQSRSPRRRACMFAPIAYPAFSCMHACTF